MARGDAKRRDIGHDEGDVMVDEKLDLALDASIEGVHEDSDAAKGFVLVEVETVDLGDASVGLELVELKRVARAHTESSVEEPSRSRRANRDSHVASAREHRVDDLDRA